jgi:hypothetical protein
MIKIAKADRRCFQRVDAFNPVIFVGIDERGEPAGNGIANVLNISQSGLCLQTVQEVSTPYMLLMVVDVYERMLKMKGKVVRRKKTPGGDYEVGIELKGAREDIKRFAASLVRVYHYTKSGR